MITVTERAATELQGLLAANNAPPGQAVKLVPSGTNSVGMSIGAPGENDEVIRQGDELLLIVDSSLAAALDGTQVDCETAMVDGQPRTEFKLRTPS
jgi:Fe-S cluster assembly iron-binding protein IscA